MRQLWEDVEEAAMHLKRMGFMTYQDKQGHCDSPSLDYAAPPPPTASNPTAATGAGTGADTAAAAMPGLESFVCVWGTRVNALEFGGAAWGKW